MVDDLLKLAAWLRAGEVKQVAMESRGVYWKPVFNLLESEFEVLVVNAKHIKFVPGRKTAVKDAHWIAQLLAHGLLRASFIPPAPQRELRELVRYRAHLLAERTREVNRVHKVLADANLKLASLATDILGVSGREMLAALIAGQTDPGTLAQLAKGRMRSKMAELEPALTGRVHDSHRLLLRLHLEHIDDLNAKLTVLAAEIAKLLLPFDQHDVLARLQTIPGVGPKVAQTILAEVGADMTRFPSPGHLASWAGRKRSSSTQPANRYLKAALVEAAHAAANTRHTFLAAQYQRLCPRPGKKRAAVAVAHSILVIAFHLIQRRTSYIELGTAHFDLRHAQSARPRLVNRLEGLGFLVSLVPKPLTA